MEHLAKHNIVKQFRENASLSKNSSHFFSPKIIQPKLTINKPNDIYEQEADAVADRVMRMPSPEVYTTFFTPKPITNIQRKCAQSEEEEKKLQMKGETSAAGGIKAPQVVNNVINSPGQSLDTSTKNFMESGFGYNFSNIQIHNDSLANQSSSEINALAYTYGNHIAFRANQYQPNTNSGKQLLAHELVHAIQQNKTSFRIQRKECNDDSFKTETYVSVKNEHDFAAADGYTQIKGPMYDILSDGKRRFFCYKDKRIYVKYNDDGRELILDLEATYPVKIEKGEQSWSQKDLVLLSEALRMLSPKEISLITGYRLVREKGVGFLTDKDKIGAALTTHDVIANDYEIEFWDSCFDGSADPEVKPISGVSPGVPCIVHEFGHVMGFERTKRISLALYNLEEFQKVYAKSSPEKQKLMKDKLNRLEAIYNKEDALSKRKPSIETEFEKLTRGKPALTEYSKTNEDEAFAEAFAIFKINPQLLKKKNLKLYQYFAREGFL